MQKLARYFLAFTALAPLAAMPTFANPLDPTVVAGDAAVSGEGTTLTVEQTTDKAIIDWRSFNIGLGEITQFNQPTSQSVVLNRVTGGEGASQILGALKANGQVFLVNPDGILFGKDAVVDVGGLVATTHDIANSDFMAGTYRFDQSGTSEASIVNLGTITVEDGGLAALVAPGVRNAGIMRANLGRIGLASADGFTLDFYGDELIQLAVEDSTAGSVIDLATGETLKDLVSNSGLLSANGGTVQLTAAAARAVVNSVVNNTGNIEADTVGTRNGKIILGAATASNKPAGAPVQSVKVSGHLSAAGVEERETGGKIQLIGELIELTVATIDAFGWSGGGTVLVGGDYMGGKGDPAVIAEHTIELEPTAIPTSAYVFADERTAIDASALQMGDGGKVILWSDEMTVSAATLLARGGAADGDGGFIETSGKYLGVRRAADASAPNGEAGAWLLDPLNVTLQRSPSVNSVENFGTFQPTGANSIIDTAVIEAALDTGTWVTISTVGTTGSGEGDVFVKSDILTTAGGAFGSAALDLQSAGDIVFSSGVNIRSSAGDLWLYFQALDGTITGANVGVIDVKNGSLYMNAEKGIVFHSSGDMPRQFVLAINQAGAPASQRVDFDIKFDDDVIRFYHQSGVAHVPSDGVRIVDSSNGSIFLDARNLDWVFYDRGMTVASHKVVGVAVDPGFNYGSHSTAFLNGIPDIIWNPPGDFPIAADPTSPDVIPVIEVSEDGGSGVDRFAPTSETGRRLIAQFGLLTNAWNWMNGWTRFGEVKVSEAERQRALEQWRELVGDAESARVVDDGEQVAGDQQRLQITTRASSKNYQAMPGTKGTVAGTLTLELSDGRVIKIDSKGNGEGYGSPDYITYQYQCVELIRRYAVELDLLDGDPNSFSVGDGYEAAEKLADLSGDAFVYVSDEVVTDAQLPKKGGVLSLAPYAGNDAGHVGIVSDGRWVGESYVVTLFDQNWPSENWRQVVFSRTPSGWEGVLTVTPTGRPAIAVPVQGWANPA